MQAAIIHICTCDFFLSTNWFILVQFNIEIKKEMMAMINQSVFSFKALVILYMIIL